MELRSGRDLPLLVEFPLPTPRGAGLKRCGFLLTLAKTKTGPDTSSGMFRAELQLLSRQNLEDLNVFAGTANA